MRRKQNAFTLIELLVVISIIALLISILMPALASAKKQARFVICQSNLKQMQLGMIYYCDEYEDKLPPYWLRYDTPQQQQVCWIKWIDEQVDNVDEIRVCPETPVEGWEALATICTWGTAKLVWVAGFLPKDTSEIDPDEQLYQYGSYTMNGWFYTDAFGWWWGPDAGNDDHYFRKYGAIKRPGETPCFSDANWLDHWPFDGRPDSSFSTGFPTNINLKDGGGGERDFGRLLIDRHNCRINHSFADGHAGPSTLPELWTLNWHNGYIPRYNAPDYENLY